MPRAIVTLITPRPRAPRPMPEAAHLRQFGLEIPKKAPKLAAASTRRHVLSALTGVAFTGTALAIAAPSAASDNPDAELLAVLAEFDALEKQIFPNPGPATIEEEEVWEVWAEPLMVRRKDCLDRLCEMETRTLEGFRARVRSLLAWNDRLMPELEKGASDGFWAPRMQLALFRGLAGERAV